MTLPYALDRGEFCPKCRRVVSEDADGCLGWGCADGDSWDDDEAEEDARAIVGRS